MQLRNALSEQLQKPMRFNEHTITGPLLADLMPVLADVLNDASAPPISPRLIFHEMQLRRVKKAVSEVASQMKKFVHDITVNGLCPNVSGLIYCS